MWGFWERANWIPVSSLYKRDWTPTPAAEAYRKLIFDEWWTTYSGTVGRDGTLSIPAFYGKYKVTVSRKSRGRSQKVVWSQHRAAIERAEYQVGRTEVLHQSNGRKLFSPSKGTGTPKVVNSFKIYR
jgi:hypothetical protein